MNSSTFRFSHYFGEGDKDQVKEMMKVIYNSRLVVEDGGLGYNIDIFCGSDTDDACQGNSGLAATNPRPGQTSVSQSTHHAIDLSKKELTIPRWSSATGSSTRTLNKPNKTLRARKSGHDGASGVKRVKSSDFLRSLA